MKRWERFYRQSRNKGGNLGINTRKSFNTALLVAGLLMISAVIPVAAALAGVTGTGDLSADRSSAELPIAL
jgi:hypothetical protein